MRTADIVIVGAGIIGLASAAALAAERLTVIVVDRQGLAAGASGACQGTLGYALERDEYDLRLRELALAAHRDLADSGLATGYRRSGELVVATAEEAAELGAAASWLRDHGHACDWLDARQVQTEEPGLSAPAGAFWISEAAQITPALVVAELARVARQRGAEFCLGAEVVEFKTDGGRVMAVRVGDDWLASRVVVLAAGAWSPIVGQKLSLSIPVTPHKGHVIVLDAQPGHLRHVISEASFGASVRAFREHDPRGAAAQPGPRVAAVLQPTVAGPILMGSSRELAGYDVAVDPARIAAIHQRASRLVPMISGLPVLRTYAGLRPTTPDGRPLLGRSSQVEGIVLATGHGGDGMTLGPLTGRLVADLVMGRAAPIELSPLAPERFGQS
jgi:glycine/D-amino acid oxidase-like deaminating enzyme